MTKISSFFNTRYCLQIKSLRVFQSTYTLMGFVNWSQRICRLLGLRIPHPKRSVLAGRGESLEGDLPCPAPSLPRSKAISHHLKNLFWREPGPSQEGESPHRGREESYRQVFWGPAASCHVTSLVKLHLHVAAHLPSSPSSSVCGSAGSWWLPPPPQKKYPKCQ